MNNNNMLEEDGTACATNSTSNVRKEELSSRGRSRYYIGSVLYDVADAVPTDIPESSGRDSPVTSGQQTGETPSHQTVISELTQRLATSATCPNSLRADRVYDVPAKNHGDTLPADQGSGQVYDDVPEEAGHHGLSLRQQAVNLSYEDVPPVPMVINDMYHTLENATGPVAPLTRSNTVTSEDTIYELVDYSDGVDGSFKEPSGLLQKLTESLRVKKPKDRQVRGKSFQLDLQKHPSPQLPPCPEGLTEKQVKRRLIVHSIVEIKILP
ncbi:hypothetical protein EB796_009035 [Bugula neritina]|uniref:Uncharacterized protein n=1 Tax=Bugula neritina TaxID=10212 RepID=A0A7J7K415_BUGNE|nr:hypothetical protein EB796_009035 [Bugula neritina]